MNGSTRRLCFASGFWGLIVLTAPGCPASQNGLVIRGGGAGATATVTGPSGQAKTVTLPYADESATVGLHRVRAKLGNGKTFDRTLLVESQRGASLDVPAGGETHNDRVVIMGQRYVLGGGVKVIAFDDPGGLDIKKTQNKGRKWVTALHWERSGVSNRAELNKKVDLIMLHTDLTRNAKSTFRILALKGYSTHFVVNWDGTIYQFLDAGHRGWHGGKIVNDRSVGVDLNNMMFNMNSRKRERVRRFMKRAKRIMKQRGTTRPVGEMRGGRLKAYGYTDAQYRGLARLLKVLTAALPNIKPMYPVGSDGKVITSVLPQKIGDQGKTGESKRNPTTDPADDEESICGGLDDDEETDDDDEETSPSALPWVTQWGIVAHWHTSSNRWDPGPGFEWKRMLHDLTH